MINDATIAVRGLRELVRDLNAASPATRVVVRKTLREVAEPVQQDAQTLATGSIRRIGLRWSRMRVGVTTRIVYVAPVRRGVKTRGADPRRRPNLADLLSTRALEPALDRNRAQIEGRVEHAFDLLVERLDHG